jgi:hypothetical protein
MPSSTTMSNCSGLAISEAFKRIVSTQLPKKRIIGSRNHYLKGTVGKLDGMPVGNFLTKKKHMEEYIASSVIVHSSDGWSYLSRSVESLFNGDIPSAIHFAYYAELRSAMSLMAFEGIGIFNKKHIWFDASKNAKIYGGQTHVEADAAMREWSNLSSKKEVVFNILKVNNRRFTDWIRETGVSTNNSYSTAVVNEWLKKWSIDLHLKQDQNLRNEMSYRPHYSGHPVDIKTTIEKIIQIWELLEPTTSNRFPLLDRHLLRMTFEEVYKKSKGKKPEGDAYKLFLTNVFSRLGEPTTQPLFDFLLRVRDPNDAIIFEEARKEINVDVNKKDPLPIICRALLMLRLSTGAAHHLIENSNVDVKDFRFWWEELALQYGFTKTNPSGIDAVELFVDIRDSIADITSLGIVSNTSIEDAFTEHSFPLFNLKQFGRTGIWGLGL